jgi:hypothetical protein
VYSAFGSNYFFKLKSCFMNKKCLKTCDLLVPTTKYVYIKSTTVYVPSSELGLPQPLSRQRECPSPQNRGGGGGHTRLQVWGWGSPNADDWRKSLTLCLLCGSIGPDPRLIWVFFCILEGERVSVTRFLNFMNQFLPGPDSPNSII